MRTHRRLQTQPIVRRRAFRFGLPVILLGLVAGCGSTNSSGVPALQADSAMNQPTAAVGRAPGDPDPTVNGCLGGRPGIGPDGKYVDLDQIVLAAQKQAPLTPTGAAEFTATDVRWAESTPEGKGFDSAARQIIAPASRALLQKVLTPFDAKGTSARIEFADGGFHLESFDPTHAVVSWLGTAHVTKDSNTVADQSIFGTMHLVAVNGLWHTEAASRDHSAEEIGRLVTPFNGGC